MSLALVQDLEAAFTLAIPEVDFRVADSLDIIPFRVPDFRAAGSLGIILFRFRAIILFIHAHFPFLIFLALIPVLILVLIRPPTQFPILLHIRHLILLLTQLLVMETAAVTK